MRVFLLSMAADIAGQSAALRQAFGRHRPGWVVDQMAQRQAGYGYPQHRRWDMHVASQCYRRADVVHLSETLDAIRYFGRRPTVVNHHGTRYRENRAATDAAVRAEGATAVASTLDLVGPEVEWLPLVADLDRLAHIRAVEYQPGRVRVAQSPTDLITKGTARLREVVGSLPLDVIHGVTWDDCLRRKANADIFVDQFDCGYGLSGVEAWAMGIPVIAGISDPAARRRMIQTFGDLPFVEATPDTLGERIRELAGDARLRREWGERGRAHVERFHSERAVVERLEPIYQRAMATRAAA